MIHIELGGHLNSSLHQSFDPLSTEALAFVDQLQKRFNSRRLELLQMRKDRTPQEKLRFPPETLDQRKTIWQVKAPPNDLVKRHVEITGPAEAKMMINALNSGADVFMADFEDALSPTWNNLIEGQRACYEGVRKTLSFVNEAGKSYSLNERTATLVVRPRGWHLNEDHLDGSAPSASLFDFGLYVFHNAQELLKRGSGPYFYLPKMEHYLEARLWEDVFNFSEESLKLPSGSLRATVLIETLPAAFQMDEILFELKNHIVGLNAGRWDYLFSAIKTQLSQKDLVFPDRSQLTMTVPFMRAYADLLVRTCHRRGAHAMGGMAAFVPSRKDEKVNQEAFSQVRADKTREVNQGFDGTWVAHPDLVPVARGIFEDYLKGEAHQKFILAPSSGISSEECLGITALQLIPRAVAGGHITLNGFDGNIRVALEYIQSWLEGRGAVAIRNLMEDAATAEISRSQLWQWVHQQAKTQDGTLLDVAFFQSRLKVIGKDIQGLFPETIHLLDQLVSDSHFEDFLTLKAYPQLMKLQERKSHEHNSR
jgi:malate synthase